MTFGHDAEIYARKLGTPPRDVLIVDPSGVSAAYSAAVAILAAGRRVSIMPLMRDVSASLAPFVAAEAIPAHASFDEQRAMFDAIAVGQYQIDTATANRASNREPAALAALNELVALVGGMTARSRREAARVDAFRGRTPKLRSLHAAPDVSVPDVSPGNRTRAIVLWAPHHDPGSLTILLFGLRAFRRDVFVVCAKSARGANGLTFVTPDAGAETLRRARLVVAADSHDPSPAIAFAERGFTVAVSSTSGVDEWLGNAIAYDPWDHRSVAAAATAGLGSPPSFTLWPMPSRINLDAPITFIPDSELAPSLSIIVPTFKRPDFLARALDSIERQTYPNVEAIVVNDAGLAVSEVVARFSRARLIEHDCNRGLAAARNTAVRAGNSKYVAFLDDDDALLPHFAGTLVEACETSGAAIAYGDFILTYAGRELDGAISVFGFKLATTNFDSTDMLVENTAGNLSFVVRRDALSDAGPFDETLTVCEDYDMWVRLVTCTEAVRVQGAVALYTLLDDVTRMSRRRDQAFVPTYRRLYQRYPVTGRPALELRRAALLADWDAHGAVRAAAPTVRTNERFSIWSLPPASGA